MFTNLLRKLGLTSKPSQENFNHRILIVDDSETDRVLIVRTLERMGCQVLVANDGQEGLEKAISEKPDLILADCDMPRMDGVEMCRKITEHNETCDIPFIFLTGVDTPKNVIDCYQLGAEKFICKPIDARALTAQIQSFLTDHFPRKAEI